MVTRSGVWVAIAISFLLALPQARAQEGQNVGSEPNGEGMVVSLGDDGVQRATLILDSYSYSPAHLVVRVGKPVEFTLKSVTLLIPHNFVLKEPVAGLDIEQTVGAGDTVTIRFTPAKTGIYTFYCDKKLLFFPSHREEGMEGRLEVTE